MGEGLTFTKEAAAAGYEGAFAHVSSHFVPFLLRAAQVAPGMRVLDIAAGTGLVTSAAAEAVGSSGYVTAADISAAMVGKARERLGNLSNVFFAVEDGQAMGFPDQNFEAVLCGLGLMFFPDPARGLAEFHRVLSPGGRTAVSVTTAVDRSYNGRINRAIARYAPAVAEDNARMFSLGDEVRLHSLFEGAGFRDVEITTVTHRFALASFGAYFGPFESGGGSTGQAYLALPDDQRRAVREEVRREVGDTGGPVMIETDIRIASGRR